MNETQIRKIIKEELAHKENVNKTVISGLFYDFKETVLVQFTKITEKIETLIEGRRKTDARIEKLEVKVSQLEIADAGIIQQLKAMDNTEDKKWDIKTILISAIIGGGITVLTTTILK